MDRVCQQALVQLLERISEPTFREAGFGDRPGRSAHMAMRRIWQRLAQAEWIVDADISDFFGSLSHELLIDLVTDSKVLSLIRSMLTAGALVDDVLESVVAGAPQGGVVSPLLSKTYLTVFDQRMAEAGFCADAVLRRLGDRLPFTVGSGAGAGERPRGAGRGAEAPTSSGEDADRPHHQGLRVSGLQHRMRHAHSTSSSATESRSTVTAAGSSANSNDSATESCSNPQPEAA